MRTLENFIHTYIKQPHSKDQTILQLTDYFPGDASFYIIHIFIVFLHIILILHFYQTLFSFLYHFLKMYILLLRSSVFFCCCILFCSHPQQSLSPLSFRHVVTIILLMPVLCVCGWHLILQLVSCWFLICLEFCIQGINQTTLINSSCIRYVFVFV